MQSSQATPIATQRTPATAEARRSAITACFDRGMAQPEIAQELGLSLDVVRNFLLQTGRLSAPSWLAFPGLFKLESAHRGGWFAYWLEQHDAAARDAFKALGIRPSHIEQSKPGRAFGTWHAYISSDAGAKVFQAGLTRGFAA